MQSAPSPSLRDRTAFEHGLSLRASVAASIAALAGCPADTNPQVLWLVTDQTEMQVALVDVEPRPY